MSILVGKHSRVVVQGGTGRHGAGFTQRMLAYGTPIVALVTPGKGGGDLFGLPIYDTVYEAVEQQGANAATVFVPPAACRDVGPVVGPRPRGPVRTRRGRPPGSGPGVPSRAAPCRSRARGRRPARARTSAR